MTVSAEIENEMFNEMFLTGFGIDHSFVIEPNFDFYNN